MAESAVPDVRRENNFREIMYGVLETDDLVGSAGLHTGQRRTHMNLMDEDLQVHCVAGIGVACANRMAQNAERHGVPQRVCREGVVTLIASLRPDLVVNFDYWRAVRYETEHVVSSVRAEVKGREIAGHINSHGGRR